MIAFIESKWKTKEEAQKIVDEISNPTDEQKWEFNPCNTSILQRILKILDDHGIKDINYSDKDSLADIIQTKVNIEQKTNEWKLRSLGINSEDLKDIKTEEDALKLAATNKLSPEETQELLRNLQIKKRQENAEILKNTNKAEFNYLITTLQNGGDPKAVMQGVKSMQEERIQQEKQNSSTMTKLTHRRPIDALEIGETGIYWLTKGDRTEWNSVYITNTGDGLYELQVADHKRVILTEQETKGYMKSFRFLENTGLGYLVRNIPPKTLSSIIALAGKDGHKVDNGDGDFTEYERFLFLKTLWHILKVKNIEKAINFSQAKEYFANAFCLEGDIIGDDGFKKMACSVWLIKNGSILIEKFEKQMRSQTTSLA